VLAVVIQDSLNALLAAVAAGHASIVSDILAVARSLSSKTASGEDKKSVLHRVLYMTGPQGRTALHLAATAAGGQHYVRKSGGGEANKHMMKTLCLAVREDPTTSVVNKLEFVRRPDNAGTMALHMAISEGQHVDVVTELVNLSTELISQGGNGDINARNQNICPRMGLNTHELGPTPLYLAVLAAHEHGSQQPNRLKNQLRLIEYLMSIGCDIDGTIEATSTAANSKNKAGTALLAAVERNMVDVVRVLLAGTTITDGTSVVSVRADPNLGVPAGGVLSSPLLLATVRGYHQIVQLLLEHNASCNIVIQTSAQQHQQRQGSNQQIQGETLVDISRRQRQYDTLQVLSSFPQCDPDYVRGADSRRGSDREL
jgi:ankyrin repeat protein